MQFFIDSQGTTHNVISDPVYQGSTNANELVLVAPFSSGNVIEADFRLPIGITTEPYLMTVQAKPMLIEGKTFNMWRCLLDGVITEYAGQVTVQFKIYQGGYSANQTYHPITPTTYASTFTVQKGVTPTLPNTPTNNIYQSILEYLSQLNPQYNIMNISYSADGYEIDTDTAVSGLVSIPENIKQKVSQAGVDFSISNIDGGAEKPFFFVDKYTDEQPQYEQNIGFKITFASATEIGKMQISLNQAYFLTALKVQATLEDGSLVDIDDFTFLAPSYDTVNVIISVNETVKSVSVIQPYEENKELDADNTSIGEKGFTNGRFCVTKVLFWKPNTDGQIIVTSSTGRTTIIPDASYDNYVYQAQQARDQAEASASEAKQSATDAENVLSEINAKAGKAGGYPILTDIDGEPKIPSVYIQQVDIKDYIEITDESELATVDAQVGDVAMLVSELDGEKTVTKSWILLSVTEDARNWAVYGTSYATNAGNATFAQTAGDAQKINGLAINGVLSETDYNALPDAEKQNGIYFVSITEESTETTEE